MYLRILCAGLILALYGLPVPARASETSLYSAECDEFRRNFPVVRFKATQRQGLGDVAAAYFNALALYENCRPETIEIEFLDKAALEKFKFLGRDNPEFLAFVHIRRSMITRAKLQIEVAADTGDINESPTADLGSHQIYIKAPVFSNSESHFRSSEVFAFGKTLNIGIPGLKDTNYGVYPDPTATQLKNLDAEQVRKFIVQRASRDERLTLISNLASKGLRIGLAYGLSSPEVSGYLTGYLKSLLTLKRTGPLVVFTPSAVLDYRSSKSFYDAKWKRGKLDILHINQLPKDWQPAEDKVYLIETPILPHDLFTALMLFSSQNGIVPLGAGDGFLSSAVKLGIPFAVSQVKHSRRVIADFRTAFMVWASENVSSGWKRLELLHLISRIFHYDYIFSGTGLENAQTLNNYRSEFKNFSAGVGDTLLQWMKLANYLKKHETEIREGTLKLDFEKWPEDVKLQRSMDRLAGKRGWLEVKIHRACEVLLR